MKRLLLIIAIAAASIASPVSAVVIRGRSATDFAVEDARVREVQKALARAGYYHYAIDGFWGLTTENAVEEFQKENDLRVTGTIDETLLHSLGLED